MTRRPAEDDELVPLPVDSRPGARPGIAAGDAPNRPGLDRRWRAVGLGTILTVLVGAAALSRPGGEPADRPPAPTGSAAPTGSGTAASPTAGAGDEPAPAGWRRGSPGPLRHREFAVQVWTGSELVVWGGDPDGDYGAAYDPATDRWRLIAPSPLPARCQGASVWTGREVLVWGEACRLSAGPSPGPSRRDLGAAAYDPATDRWRLLPPGPVTGGQPLLSVWTGTEWVLAESMGPAAAFDPTTDRWRPLPSLPRPSVSIVGYWTGREILILGAEISENGPSTAGAAYRHWAAALDPASEQWRGFAAPPLELATAVWDGKRLIAWDQNLHSAALEPAPGSGWEPLGDLPLDFTDCSPQGVLLGEVVFAEHCGRGALFDPEAGRWEEIPHPRSLAELPVWTGTEALFWVGSFAGSADGVWRFSP